MGRNCVVLCTNTQKKGVSLFKFPEDSKLKKAWTQQVQRTRNKWKGPSAYSAVCSEHFTENCFEVSSLVSKQMGLKMKQRLKPDGIPTIFARPTLHDQQHINLSVCHQHMKKGRELGLVHATIKSTSI